MGKYDTAVRCGQIASLIEENQYLKAMEEIETLDFASVPSISDLYLFADLFLKAEKLDVAKELYYTVYRRTASRPALYRLLMLTIRMGDIEEAKDLYLAYEIIAGMTLDTYELRYRLAKAEGEPRSRLIEILEQLKQDEYTEEWGFQLATLYEIEGMREECIRECDDIVRWFGAGSIVEKAKKLRERCLSPSWVKPIDVEVPEPEKPDLEEDAVRVAWAPAEVKEIPVEVSVSEEKTEKVPETMEEVTDKEETLTAVEEVADEEETLEPIEEAADEEETSAVVEEVADEEETLEPIEEVADEEETSEPIEEVEQQPKANLFKRIANYFKVDLEFGEEEDDFPDELDTYKQQSTAEINVKAILAQGVGGIMEETTQPPGTANLDVKPTAKLPVESLEERLQEVEEQKKVINLDDTMQLVALTKSHPLGVSGEGEVYEDVSRNGIRYCTLKGAIYKLRQETGVIHFVLCGGAEGITLAVAKKLFKELKKNHYFEAKNIGKISADKLDEINLDEWAEKFIGGCMYIMEAPLLSAQSVKNLNRLMEKYGKQIVIILEGSFDEMDSFLNYNKELEQNITYKIRL